MAVLQLVSALVAGGGSIWYGAWFQDAQLQLHEQLRISAPQAQKPSFWAVTMAGWTWESPVPYTFGSLLLGVIAGVGVYVTAARVQDLEKMAGDFQSEQEAHAETQRHYHLSLHEHLQQYFCHKIPNFDDSCRASIYRHDPGANAVRMVFRHSAVTRYDHKGRVSIPDSEGIVGAVLLNKDDAYVNKLPVRTNVQRYAKAVNKLLLPYGTSILEATLQRLRMPSRCYYAFAIRDVNSMKKVAVLVLESLNEDHFDPVEVRKVLEAQGLMAAQYVRHITRLDSVLNPYGT